MMVSDHSDHRTTLILGAQQTVECLKLVTKRLSLKLRPVLALLTILSLEPVKLITIENVNEPHSTVFIIAFNETTLCDGFVFI